MGKSPLDTSDFFAAHPGCVQGPEQKTKMFQGIRQGFAVCKGQQTHLSRTYHSMKISPDIA